MDFSRVSDGIRLHHASHHGYDDDEPDGAAAGGHGLLADPGGPGAGGFFFGHHAGVDHSATPELAPSHVADLHHVATANSSADVPSLGSLSPGIGSGSIESGANAAGNGGNGYFYGDIVHASLLIYEPINIAVELGYGSVALADQTNNLSVDQSAFQMAGVGGNGGNANVASGGSVGALAGTDMMIATGGNSAGNGGSGYFSGALVDAPVVIYHPVNIAVAATDGTAQANQSNTVEIDQSATQIAGVGGNGGTGNVAAGGSVLTLDPAWGSSHGVGASDVQTGGNQAGNGGDGSFSGELVHTSFALYDPVNIAVAGYNSTSYALQLNDVHVDQSTLQIAGIGGSGGNGNVAIGGIASLLSGSLLSHGGSDSIDTGSNSAGNGGNGHFAGSLIDVSVAIYAPINIAIAGPHATAEADQINNVQIDQSAVQIAGVGGDGGSGNLALGGGVTTHLSPDLHLV
ncbi:MAG TPA: hypothetical protein VMU69_04350 [Bradyrhizobium sp.]|nr:hypothetical protein [Bradyrhizobium sp.]